MERRRPIYKNNWNLLSYLYTFFNSGILFLTFPITFPQSFQLMLVVQTIIIASAAFPLYGIAIHFIENKNSKCHPPNKTGPTYPHFKSRKPL